MSATSVRTGGALESLVAQVADEFLERQRRGERPTAEEYATRHPEAAELLRRVLASLEVLGLSGQGAAEGVETGQPLGDYRIVREVGRGGMGVVYEAVQLSLGRRVALKVLPFAATMDPRQLQRFHNEARAAASLEHPHIVPVYGVGCERAVHFYAMKFIEGRTLADVLARHEGAPADRPEAPAPPDAETSVEARATTRPAPLDPAYFRRVAEWGVQAAEALEYAHGLGIVHRDVKPANLIIDGQGELWVTDFGLARTGLEGNLTMTGDVLGTLRYTSPEQALVRHGLVDHRSDVYSLGATLYELLTGHAAIQGKDRREIIEHIDRGTPVPPRKRDPRVPADLETVVLKCLEKEPQDRYSAMKEVAEDLRRFLAHRPIRAKRPGLLVRLRKWGRRHAGAVSAVGAGLLLVVAGLLVGVVLLAQERAEAVRQRQQAEESRTIAVAKARDLRRNLYPAQINQAHQAWKVGNVQQVRDLLANCLPEDPEQEDLRGFEWYYLRQLCEGEATERVILSGHSSDVFGLDYSPDGKTIATTSRDKTARLWEAATGKPLRVLRGHLEDVNCAVFSQDGRTLVTSGEDGTIRTWDVETGQQRALLAWFLTPGHDTPEKNALVLPFTVASWFLAPCFSGGITFPAPLMQVPLIPVPVGQVVLAPDGQTLAGTLRDGNVFLLDYPSGRQRLLLRAHPPRAESVAFCRDGNTLVTSGRDGTAKVWNLPSGQPRLTLRAGNQTSTFVTVARRFPLAATGDQTGKIIVWNLNTGQPVLIFSTHRIQWVAFSPDDTMLAASNFEGGTSLWDVPSGKFLRNVHEGSRTWGVTFS